MTRPKPVIVQCGFSLTQIVTRKLYNAVFRYHQFQITNLNIEYQTIQIPGYFMICFSRAVQAVRIAF